jgi:hypothetical protein
MSSPYRTGAFRSTARGRTAKFKILIADDREPNLDLLDALLKPVG